MNENTKGNTRGKMILWTMLWSLLFLTFAFIPLSFSLSTLGEQCRFSGECMEGYCLDGTCRFPTILEKFTVAGNCSYTAECREGFCREGSCIMPMREEYDVLTFGVKSGCAGIIDNCTGILCALCDVSWVLLIAGSAVAAFVGRHKGRLVPFILFFLPILIGLVIFPILGFVLALIELFILAITKKEIVAVI